MLAPFSLMAAFFFALGRSYAFCCHFSCILAVFCDFWDAPNSIFGGIFGHCAVISAENPAGIHLLLFVSTCSAAVRAKHIRRLPKGGLGVPDPGPKFLLCCLPLRPASKLRLEIPASRSFLRCLPPILNSFPRTRTDRRTSPALRS